MINNKRIIFNEEKLCAGCGVCAAVCPKHCIEIGKDDLGFNIALLANPEECIYCGKCKRSCPQQNIKEIDIDYQPPIYFGQTKVLEDLNESASGGVFSLLATFVLNKGGVVWGVEMSSLGQSEFCCIHTVKDLYRLRGSKYTEVSRTFDFRRLKMQLDEGILVMVSGTPCQILSIYNFLGKKQYKNLILVDLLCYGIQSPKMWKLYLDDVNPNCKPIKSINMRSKDKSWFNYSMRILFEDNSLYVSNRWNDSWLLTYSRSIFNRKSCSDCQAKKFKRVSDITIGDYWHLLQYKDKKINYDKNKGVSVVILNSESGKVVFDVIKNKFNYKAIKDNKYILQLIKNYSNSANVNPIRDVFISSVNNLGFSKTVYTLLDYGLSFKFKKIYHIKTDRYFSSVKRKVKYFFKHLLFV